jgi:hypothetical protein
MRRVRRYFGHTCDFAFDVLASGLRPKSANSAPKGASDATRIEPGFVSK